ncbi:MAG: M43 family zinc metalloprotease, partial [Bacteroidota bacterium]
MKKTILSLLLACSLLSLFAQELKHCGADELRISALKQMPEVARAVIRRDEELEAFTKKFVSAANHKDDAEYVIPVVFHVIHNYGPENISNAQILDGIDVLNKTFRKLLADTGSLVEEFKPLHADTKIEFRLATKDPDGNCHSGINRIASALTTKGDHSVKTLVHWPQNKYLNIYIVAQAAGLAGHCVWPADADTIPEWDGIVVGYNYVGSIEQSDYTRSVALAHECGHYLNLHHIWGGNNVPGFYYLPCGDVNKDCSIDDLVADTPPTIGWQTCNLNAKSCGSSRDMVQNVMDYSYCNRVFTTGQKLRMQACLNSPIAGRNNLWSQSNRLATGTLNAAPLCAADFGSSRGVICQGDGASVVFSDLSYGSGGSNTFSWSFEGGTPAVSSQRNPTVTYAAAGTYAVSLTVGDGSNSYTITRDHFITVLPEQGAAYPLSESFEQLDSLEGSGWMGASQDPGAGWEITSAAAYTGTKSVRLANFGSLEPTSDQFYGKTTDLSGVTGPVRLTFRYAYAKSSADDKTSATIYFASDCNT